MKHVKSHNIHFACKECRFTSNSEFAFEMHMENDHGQDRQKTCFTCTSCGMIFGDEQDLNGHIKRQHKTSLEVVPEDCIEEPVEIGQPVPNEIFKCDKCTLWSKLTDKR